MLGALKRRLLPNGLVPFFRRYGGARLFDVLYETGARLYGRRLRLDASSVCQLKCPACSTASGVNRRGVIGAGHLKPEDFRRLVEGAGDIKMIELSNWGEIFLNPGLNDIMRTAHEHGIALIAMNGVNLNTVSPEQLEGLVKYRFHALSVSIDGASAETYARYRVGGDFERVLANLREINRLKKKYKSPFPKLHWQFIIFGHNEHELPAARKTARALGMKFRPKLNHTPDLFPVRDRDFVRKESGFGAADRREYRANNSTHYSYPCGQMWSNPQVNWDGKLLGCCVNKYGDFGNVFETGLRAGLRSEKYRYAKAMVLGRKPPREDIPCYKCKTYWKLNPRATR